MMRRRAVAMSDLLVWLLVAAAVATGLWATLRYQAASRDPSGLGREFVYDMSGMMAIDPNLLLYTEVLPIIATGMDRAICVSVGPDGLIYVGGDRSVRSFDAGGAMQKVFACEGTPLCLAIGEDRVYVGVMDRIHVFDGEGHFLQAWPSLDPDAVLTSLALSADALFAADAGKRVVVRYDLEGQVVAKLGEKDPDRNIPGFVVPSPYFDLALDAAGLLRVVNPGRCRVETYTQSGEFVFSWGESGTAVDRFCGCCNPVNFALLPDGGFVTCEKGLVRVKIYDSDGVFLGVVAGPQQLAPGALNAVCQSPEECQSGGFDVAVGLDGEVYVLDTLKNQVRRFRRKEGTS